ncbi:MAG: CDP-diacylglycerol--glycerol-3-phosphate 3-phosphatidyltransferase [Minwuia sp.]|nr:CDP-diacylglycerol--glycerol-3-phosphate 3-phosphatidyltransferase [Minwuia sp.]
MIDRTSNPTALQRHVPNVLTGLRVAAIPFLLIAFFLPAPWSDWLPLILFMMASVTDWLDGKLARHWNAGSKLGQFMDPMADKLLVVAIIVMLVSFGTIGGWHVIPAIAILCREMFVSGLREFLAFRQVEVPVSGLAKWKTTTQMLALTVLLVPLDLTELPGLVLFWVAGYLALQTGYAYLRAALPQFMDDAS